MTGIEILSSKEVLIESCFNWRLCLIVGFSILGLFALVGLFESIKSSDWGNMVFGILIGILIGTLIGTLIGVATSIPTYETQYKVLISDEVSMNDFNAKYEVVDQEGKIYIIRERN